MLQWFPCIPQFSIHALIEPKWASPAAGYLSKVGYQLSQAHPQHPTNTGPGNIRATDFCKASQRPNELGKLLCREETKKKSTKQKECVFSAPQDASEGLINCFRR